jgi:hypothetical protein
MKGKFTLSSSRVEGTQEERSYEYEALQVDRFDDTTIGESDKDEITESDLQQADRIFYRLKGGKMDDDETAYKWVAGPFPSKAGLVEAIEDIEVYGSPEPLPDFSKVQ